MLVALVVALGLVDTLVGLLPVAAARVVCDLAPGVLVACGVPAQPAERLRPVAPYIFSVFFPILLIRRARKAPRCHL